MKEVEFVSRTYDYEAGDNKYQVEWDWIGEGNCGDWDRDNPDDSPRLRFWVLKWNDALNDWEEVEDSSYCTMITDTVPDHLLELFSDNIAHSVIGKSSYKRRLEELTWVSEEELHLAYEKEKANEGN